MKRLFFILILLGINQAFASPTPQKEETKYTKERAALVKSLRAKGIKNEGVLSAISKVQRHEFIPDKYRERSYENVSLPIGKIQTISQPYMVALMTEATRPKPGQKVLEIGTGTGYAAAVWSELVPEVYTIEIEPELARTADARLKRLGYTNVHVKDGDGFYGWPEVGPFDAIILTCNAEKVPPKLAEQLKEGGRIIMPLGATYSNQTLVVITKTNAKLVSRPIAEVQFVPMVGDVKK
ncbi:MAG: protein-L-isoaspartate O-methyltransferase [Deltaproteobacteria bacterium CG11_big_fil_rev_8_21_14_0_20_49_13]|nr:MAG: protein-L-isoaspartate O-methyltransferase [Deltaproteobacteria bacterium CG11_big_fil_rev_8_21_14_0_20_49_13]